MTKAVTKCLLVNWKESISCIMPKLTQRQGEVEYKGEVMERFWERQKAVPNSIFHYFLWTVIVWSGAKEVLLPYNNEWHKQKTASHYLSR